ncbi:hypothetical protein [Aeromicrobium alkaliterrae]|uniref:hypothetical protein n=1 Tax=Aeromicrobium alkaliterrae TaxID=302168 RepID=UPI0031D4801E
MDALRSNGLFQMCAPIRVGGAEQNARTLVEVVSCLSRGDASAGWVAMIANCTAWTMGLLPDEARMAVYGGGGDVIAISQFGAGGTATPSGDQFVVDGRWPFASGSDLASWTIGGVKLALERDGTPELRWALMPVSAMTVVDDWNVAGMAASGSKTLVASDLAVPVSWTIPFEQFKGHAFAQWHCDETVFRTSVSAVACLALVAPLWGMVEEAWDITYVEAQSGRPIRQWNYDDARDAPGWRSGLAIARSKIDTGMFHLLRAADDIDDRARRGEVLTIAERSRIRNDQAVATVCFRTALDLLMDLNGARSFKLDNPLQRIWRDFGVASRHGLNNVPLNRDVYAHSLAGLDMEQFYDRL